MEIPPFLSGGGEMGAQIRSFDWASTSAGPVQSWPQSLRTTVATVLRSRWPMSLWWGRDLLCFYNDTFRSIMGDGQNLSYGMGVPGHGAGPEMWAALAGPISKVFSSGEGMSANDVALPARQNGKNDDVYWAFSFSPVLTEEGNIGGVLVTGMETTTTVKARSLLEEKARQLEIVIDSAGLGTWDADLINHTFIFNQRLKDFFGFDGHEEPVMKDFLSRLSEKDQQRLTEAVASSQAKGSNGRLDIEYTIHLPGKEGRDVLVRGSTVFGDEGNPIRFTGTVQDVTEKNLTLKALQASHREIVELFHDTPVAIATINGDEELHILSANRCYGELAGRNPEEIVGRPLLDAIPEIRGQGFDQALFSSLVEAAPFPIGVYLGADSRIQYANPAIVKIYGKGPDVIGRPYLELLPELEQQGIGEQIRQVYTTGRPFFSDTSRVDIDDNGSVISYYFKYSFTPILQGDRVVGVFNTGVDLTEVELARQRAVQAETALRSAIELAELANWTIDIAARRIFLPPRLQMWTGIDEEDITLDEFLSQVPVHLLRTVRASYEKTFEATQDGTIDIEHPLMDRKSGHIRFIHVRGQVVSDAAQRTVRISGTMQDITAQRALQWELKRQVDERTAELAELNIALQEANEELERKNAALIMSNDELSQYAYVTSHDLQEPLRKIRIFASMLSEKMQLNAETKRLMTKMINASERMTQLIQDLLTFSRLLGTNELMQPVNLEKIIAAVLEDFELSIQEKGVIVHVGPLPALPGISLQLNQLFYNLVGNALKFSSRDRTPVISISARQLPPQDVDRILPQMAHRSYVEITVSDNGVGFESQFAEHIFELFKQLHSRNTYPGSGIGLALCRRIVKNHYGHIYADSVPDQGSNFHIILPISQS